MMLTLHGEEGRVWTHEDVRAFVSFVEKVKLS
jgi:hypothetical protein